MTKQSVQVDRESVTNSEVTREERICFDMTKRSVQVGQKSRLLCEELYPIFLFQRILSLLFLLQKCNLPYIPWNLKAKQLAFFRRRNQLASAKEVRHAIN
uniref:Uncharacterized protein n=1 Tax=Steinernema glaseri TaxID=37863 RepID=A0A1I8AI27_9BILA